MAFTRNGKSGIFYVGLACKVAVAISIGLQLLGFEARAAAQCRDLFLVASVWQGNHATFRLIDSKIPQKTIAKYDAIIGEVNGFLGDLAAPARPIVEVQRSGSVLEADSAENVLHLSAKYQIENPAREGSFLGKSPSATMAAVAHEYGHLIFEKNFTSLEDLVLEFRKLRPQVESRISELMNERQRLLDEKKKVDAQLDKAPEGEEREKLADRSSYLRTRSMAIFGQVLELSHAGDVYKELVIDHLTSYNEFFADVVAILWSENPDAISKSVRHARLLQLGEFKEKASLSFDSRSFQKHQKAIREDGGSMVSTLSASPGHLEDHAYFAPARKYLWESYLSSPTILKSHKKETLTAVFKAVDHELHYRMNHYDLKPEENWKNFNRRLIERIKIEFASLGVEAIK